MNILTKRVPRAPYEFERVGPIARQPAGHKPDFTLSVNRPPKNRSFSTNSFINSSQIKQKKNVTIDMIFLVDLLHTSDFSNCLEIDGSSKHLNAIDLTAIRQLSSLTKADFSDNSLPLEPFAVLPSLEELDLSCNSLKSFDYKSSESMTGDDRAWASLHTLNLSFNSCSQFLSDLQLIPLLADLNLASNSLSYLPSNLMHFTCLTDLNLANNNLNSDAAFFSLATIPSLRNLNLDGNNIMHIPKFQFGFEALIKLSMKNNKIEMFADIESLLDLNLEEVNILGNPILLRPPSLAESRQKFASLRIRLICDAPPPSIKRSLPPNMRTVAYDPLTLPTFSKAHVRALNRKRVSVDRSVPKQLQSLELPQMNSPEKQKKVQKPKAPAQPAHHEDDVFMTAFGSRAEDDEQEFETPENEVEEEEEEEIIISSIWNEVPVVQLDKRKKLTPKRRNEFLRAYSQLQFVVSHPDLRLKPRESPSMATEETEETEQTSQDRKPQDIIKGPKIVVVEKKKPVASQLAARTEYTKTEIQKMLSSMQERLGSVERDLQVADESGQTAVEIALDQKNFASLHKQYEQIRAELINTLNS